MKYFSSFDDNDEVRWLFLDISKAFDKAWHEGIIHKLTRNGISGNLLSLLTDVLSKRKQSVILNGQSSSWAYINAGVPQGSILGPFFQCNPSYLLTTRPCFLLLKCPKEQLIT